MSAPSEMPQDALCLKRHLHCLTEERKRYYSALRRAIQSEAPPQLVAKYGMAGEKEKPLVDKVYFASFSP